MSSARDLPWRLDDVIDATHATLLRRGPVHQLSGVTTDSRHIPPDALFVGIPGERFDGSAFGAAALKAGAGAVLVSRARAAEALEGTSGTVLAVDAPLTALALLARTHRLRMPAKVVAVTGSVGKTTAKEMLAAALSLEGATLATEGNLNNEIGAPLTLLALRPEHRFAVVELGMNHEGEISRLTEMTRPHVGIVTCAAGVHLEALETVENVSRAKGELYSGLPLDAVAVVNADDVLMSARARWAGRRSISFGHAASADVRIVSILSHDRKGLAVDVEAFGERLVLKLPVVGLHNAMNACAAFAAAGALGLSHERIAKGLSTARPPGRRLRLTPIPGLDASLLDDCYNANPASMVAALETLSALVPQQSRMAVLGDMREMGADEVPGHRLAGTAAAQANPKLLVAFGPASRHIAAAAIDAGLDASRIVHTEDPAAAAEAVSKRLVAGDLVLVKASRGTRLERVSDLLAPPVSTGEGH